MASGHGRRRFNVARFVRLGRIADERDKSPNFRFWLQAVVRRIVIYVGFTSSFGHPNAENPLLSVQRTQPDESWTAA